MSPDLRSPAVPPRVILLGDTPDGFGTYHDLVQSSGATTVRTGDAFAATVTAYNFPRFTLFDRQIVGAEHRRRPAEIRRDGFEHFYLQVLRSGRMACGRPGEEHSLSPGDAVLFDATLPQRTIVVDADYVTVTLGRDLVESLAPNARRLHGRMLPRTAAGSLGEVVLSLARRIPGLAASPVTCGGRMIAGRLGEITGTAPVSDQGFADAEEVDLSRRLKAERFIAANLGRPGLDVGTVARGIGVSRTTLYRAFRDVGGIEREIVMRRVARLRSAILQPSEVRSIEALAHEFGFSSSSHCSRVFKQTYGLAPNGLRAELRQAQDTNASHLEVDRMRQWYRSLNLPAGDTP